MCGCFSEVWFFGGNFSEVCGFFSEAGFLKKCLFRGYCGHFLEVGLGFGYFSEVCGWFYGVLIEPSHETLEA